MSESTYVVQIATFEVNDGPDTWEDIDEVTVPAKTKRRTVIEKALDGIAGALENAAQPIRLRVIPAEFAVQIPVEWEQPPPRLKIGGEAQQALVVDGPPDMG